MQTCSAASSVQPPANTRPPQQQLLRLRQQIVAPVDQGPQGAMAGQRGPTPTDEETEAIVEPVGDLLDGQDAHAGGRQLDGQRDAVEPAADPCHGTPVRSARAKPGWTAAARSAKADRLGPRRLSTDGDRPVRLGQRRHRPDHLAIGGQGLATCGQDRELGDDPEQASTRPAQARATCSQLSRINRSRFARR